MVKRLRIRRKGKGLDREVTILAYESMRTNESLTSIDKIKRWLKTMRNCCLIAYNYGWNSLSYRL